MSLPQAFFDALDETPRTPTGVLVRTDQGELRSVPIATLAALGRREMRSTRHPRVEARARYLELLAYLIAKEER